MFFIRSFPCHLNQTEELATWLEEVSLHLHDISYNRLRFLVHEAFVNACKFSSNSQIPIVVVIKKGDKTEIAVTDQGDGFQLPSHVVVSDKESVGLSWRLVNNRELHVLATIEEQNKIRFLLETHEVVDEDELNENHRGLISILKTVDDLSYHYMPHSLNYLHLSF